MWNLLKITGRILKALFWSALIVALTLVLLLYLVGRDFPAPVLHQLEDALSSDDLYIRIGRMKFSLDHGICLQHVKALPKRYTGGPLLAADEITLDLTLWPQTPLTQRIRSVNITNLSMPALPSKNNDHPLSMPELPDLAPFPLTLNQVDILGIKAQQFSAQVDVNPTQIAVRDILIKWPKTTHDMSIEGNVILDMTKGSVAGSVKGEALPENLLPLFHILKARGAIEQIECFSDLSKPVKASYSFDVDIATTDFSMRLDLDVGPCAYRHVPLSYAKGTLGIYGTNIFTTVVIDPLDARTQNDEPISGALTYREETEGLDIKATTTMAIDPFVSIINVLNHGELNTIRCKVPPHLAVNGVVALSLDKSHVTNDLSGTIALDGGTILNFSVNAMTSDFQMQGHQAYFRNVTGHSASGGKLAGEVTFSFPNYAATATIFNTQILLDDVELSDISEAFNVTNERAGLVSGKIQLDGTTYGNTMASLGGKGHVDIKKGVINRMKLFAGLTGYLSRNIPGVSSLVNQSTGSMDFTIEKGILATDNLLIEGDLFSLKGHGTYNMNTDKLDFTVRVSIFRQKTIAGRIVRLVTLPFSRLLLEFKVFDSLENPNWTYVNIIERITDGLSDISEATPNPKP